MTRCTCPHMWGHSQVLLSGRKERLARGLAGTSKGMDLKGEINSGLSEQEAGLCSWLSATEFPQPPVPNLDPFRA